MISGNQTYERGDNITLNCPAIGGPYISYNWQVNGTNISGENSTTLMLANVNASNGGDYSCVVFNNAGDDSASTFVFISPYFTAQPENRGGSNESNINLICEAEAFPAPQYQWARVEGETIRDAILGVNSTMLSFSPLVFGDEGSYFCNVTSGRVTIQSDVVTLTGNSYNCVDMLCLMQRKIFHCNACFYLSAICSPVKQKQDIYPKSGFLNYPFPDEPFQEMVITLLACLV